METYDYRMIDTDYTNENNCLLDMDGYVEAGLRDPQAQKLAELAHVINKHNDTLTSDSIEKAVLWLKRIREKRQGPSPYSGQEYGAFYRALEALKNTPEQVSMQKAASWCAIKSHLLGLVVLVCVLVFVLLYSLDISKWWTAMPGFLGWYSFDMMQEQTKKSFVIAKEQDRRYFMQSMRMATNVDELNEAGFFMYIKSMEMDKGFDQAGSTKAARIEIQRMRDAIYFNNPFEYD